MVGRRAGILVVLLLLAAAWAPTASAATVEAMTISQIQARMADGRLTSESLVRTYLRRIASYDRKGPALHAVIVVNPDAMRQARALDRERRENGPRGPLHGIPILLKDNIESADPMATTAGSLALRDNVTRRDAPLVARLRAAGAVILGKTNMSEWANFRSTHSISGWSAVGGLVRNPHLLDRSACGSSAGSAVAVAADFAAAAVGTETDGSIVCPSAMNGVVGLKPTLGLVSRSRIVPISASQDTAGPMGRSVADVAALLTVMAGSDAADAATAEADAHKTDYAAGLVPGALAGRRIGVLRFAEDRRPELEAPYAAALDILRSAGAVLVEVASPAEDQIEADETLVLETEFKAGVAAYLADAAPQVKSRTLADLIAFNAAEPAETALFGQETFESADRRQGLDDPAYLAARERSRRMAGPEGLGRLLDAERLDALVAPTTGPSWRFDLVVGDHFPGSFSTLPAVAGYPHLTVPMGEVRGLPVGISFIGPAWSEARLLALGRDFELHAPAAPRPGLLTALPGE